MPWLLIPVAVFVVLAAYLWYTRRFPNLDETVIAQYGPPERLRAAELGVLKDGKVHPEDVTAAILELAVKGYVKISLEKKLGPDAYILTIGKKRDSKLRRFEHMLIKDLFKEGDTRVLRGQKGSLSFYSQRVQDRLIFYLQTHGYFHKKSPAIGLFFYGITFVMMAVTGGLLEVAEVYVPDGVLFFFIAMTLTSFELGYFANLASKRTKQGTKLFTKALGFKEYLRVAERDRIHWQVKEGMFEKWMPYAVAFGIEKSWAQTWEDNVKKHKVKHKMLSGLSIKELPSFAKKVSRLFML